MAAIFGGKKEKKSKSVATIEAILEDADTHLKDGDTDKAASEYRRAHRYLYREENITASPEGFSEMFTRTGHGLFDTGEPDRAVECFDKATQLNPKNLEAWMSRGVVHLKTETMLNFASMCFDEVLKQQPDNIEALENQAETYLLSEKKDDAIEVYQKLVEIEPDNEDFKKKLEELAPVTLSTITEQLKKTPKDAKLWWTLAGLLEKDGKTAKAIESYLRIGYLENKPDAYEKVLDLNPKNRTAIDKLLSLKPDDIGLLEKKVTLLESEGLEEEVQELYQKLADLDPSNETYKAKLKEVEPDEPEAVEPDEPEVMEPDELEAVEQALASDPDNVEALTKKASLLEAKGDVTGASEIFMKLVKLAPEDTKAYENALKYKPDDVNLLNTKGDIHFDREEYEDALACFEKIASLLPKDVNALHNKGAVLFKLEKFDDAVATFDQLLDIDSDDVTAYLTKGAALFKAGKLDEAVDALNNVVKREPTDVAAWYYKASAEAMRGNTKPVVPFLSRAIEMDDDFKERAKTDPSFDSVRDTPEFKALFE